MKHLKDLPTSPGVIEMTSLSYRLAVEAIDSGDLDAAVSGLFEALASARAHLPYGQGPCLDRLALIAQYTGRPKRALHFFKASYGFHRTYFLQSDEPFFRHGYAASCNQLGMFYMRQRRCIRAQPILEEAVRIFEELVSADDNGVTYHHDLAMAYENLGLNFLEMKDAESARICFGKLKDTALKLLGLDADKLEYQILLVRTLKMEGAEHLEQRNYGLAEKALLDGLETLERIIARQQRRIFFVVDTCLFRMQLARLYQMQGQYQTSMSLYTEIINAYDDILDNYPEDHTSRFNQAHCIQQQGLIWIELEEEASALAAFQDYVWLMKEMPDQSDLDVQFSISVGNKYLGTLHHNLGHIQASLSSYQIMYRLADHLYQQHRRLPHIAYHFAVASVYAGHLNIDAGSLSAAVYHFAKSVEVLEELCLDYPADPVYQRDLANAMDLYHEGLKLLARSETGF